MDQRRAFIRDYAESSDPAQKAAAHELLGNPTSAALIKLNHRLGHAEVREARRHIEKAWADMPLGRDVDAVEEHQENSPVAVESPRSPCCDAEILAEAPGSGDLSTICASCRNRVSVLVPDDDGPGYVGHVHSIGLAGVPPGFIDAQTVRRLARAHERSWMPPPGSGFATGGELPFPPRLLEPRPLTEEQKARMLDPIENAKLAIRVWARERCDWPEIRIYWPTPDPVWERRRRDRDRREARKNHERT